MTQFNPSAPGNKGIPAPREGYEQRKVAHKKYKEAEAKGWTKRIDDRKQYNGIDWVLCERKIEQEVTVKYIEPIDVPVECLPIDTAIYTTIPPHEDESKNLTYENVVSMITTILTASAPPESGATTHIDLNHPAFSPPNAEDFIAHIPQYGESVGEKHRAAAQEIETARLRDELDSLISEEYVLKTYKTGNLDEETNKKFMPILQKSLMKTIKGNDTNSIKPIQETKKPSRKKK